MTVTTTPAQDALLAGGARGITFLFDLDFQTGPIYITNYVVDIPANGHTYLAVGSLLSVSDLRESQNLGTEKLTINVSIVNTAMLASLIGPASVYRNRPVKIYAQLLDSAWVAREEPILRWEGFMDKVRVDRRPSKDGKGYGTVQLDCQRAGLSRFRNATGLRMTHGQQQFDYPGDMGLEYTESLVTNPPVWLSRRYQEQK